jgi:RNA polymerase sigma-70 factor (ECF subfamily)
MTDIDYGRAYQSGFKRTVRFLISKGVIGELAEEIAQAAWTRGWERLEQLRNELSVSTWVNKIAFNLYRRGTYSDRRQQPLMDISCESNVNVAAIDLARLMNSCCPADQALLKRQLQGLTASEIAHEVGTTETAVRIRLMRARRSARSVVYARAS